MRLWCLGREDADLFFGSATLVDVAPLNSIERILSRKSLFIGRARLAAVWSVLATVLLVVLLFDLILLVGLVIDRGRLDLSVTKRNAERFQRLTGIDAPRVSETDDSDAENYHIFEDEKGILPAVWQTRDLWWGPAVGGLYRNVGWLQSNMLGLIWLLAVGALTIMLRNFCLRQSRMCAHRVAIDAVSATRRNLHRQVLRLGPEDLDGTGHEVATHLFKNEVETVRIGLYEWITRSFRFPLELAALSLVLLSLNWRLALQWIAPFALAIFLLNGVLRTALRRRDLAADKCRDEEQLLLSSLKNSRLARGLGVEQSEHDLFQKQLDRYHARLLDEARATEFLENSQPKIVIAGVALIAFLLFLLGVSILTSTARTGASPMTPAFAVAFLIAVVLSLPGIRYLRTLGSIRHDMKIAADKILRYLDQIPSVSQAVGAKFLQPMSKTLHFENVRFRTPNGRQILDGIDFKLEVDKTYAVVSLDSLEARSIALMLPRFIEPQQGRILIDGEDIAWGTLESLRAEVAFVAASDAPFEGTVFDNLRGGHPEVTLQQATEAAKITRAHNFIVKLFNGYDTVLTSHGDSLDDGQRFRLNLARAIVRNPALLIIEEPTAVLDDDTKSILADAYDRICRERTVIFLPARMSTVRRTDAVLVLHEGKVVAFGPHEQLVTQSPIYRHWEYLNFNEFRHNEPEPSA